MNIKQEIAELKAKLAKLEAEANEPLDCYFGKGFVIEANGYINSYPEALHDNDYTQIRKIEVAEQIATLVQIQRALINFKCEHDPVFDRELLEEHWTIEKCIRSGEYVIDNYSGFYTISEVWFSTKELAQAALDMLKRKNLV